MLGSLRSACNRLSVIAEDAGPMTEDIIMRDSIQSGRHVSWRMSWNDGRGTNYLHSQNKILIYNSQILYTLSIGCQGNDRIDKQTFLMHRLLQNHIP